MVLQSCAPSTQHPVHAISPPKPAPPHLKPKKTKVHTDPTPPNRRLPHALPDPLAPARLAVRAGGARRAHLGGFAVGEFGVGAALVGRLWCLLGLLVLVECDLRAPRLETCGCGVGGG